MKSPFVSVIIPAYNQELFLPEALESVLSQTYPNIEILVVDDGSVDGTTDICKRYQQKDSRVRPVFQVNRGPSTARNTAILRARGEYVCLLDSDDRMAPTRVEEQLKPFCNDPSIDVVYTSVLLIDTRGVCLGEIRGQTLFPEDFRAEMFFRNLIPGPGLMAKRGCFLHELYNPSFVHAEDYELMLRFLNWYRFFYLEKPLTLYRRHGANLSENLPAHRAAELRALNQYSREYIEKVIQATGRPQEEKKLLLGKILFNKELFQEAIDVLKNSSLPYAHFYRGNCLFKLHRFDEAKHCFELALDESNPASYNNLAVLHMQKGESAPAKKLLKKALELKKEYQDAAFNLSLLQKKEIREPKMTLKELRSFLIPYFSKE